MQKSTNTLMCSIQCITVHHSKESSADFYLVHDFTDQFPISSIVHVHKSVPFARDEVRVSADLSDETRSTSDEVSLN